MRDVDSTKLLIQAKAGSPEALNALFQRYAPRMLAVIRLRMGRDLRAHLESRDILAATMLKAFQRIEQVRGTDPSSLVAWLARIAENEIRDQRDYHRRARRDAAQVVEFEAGLNGLAARVRSQSSRIVLDEALARLEHAIESLDEAHREVLLLRKFEELSFSEIAERLGRSPDACRMLLARAMTALTLRMREET
jgi:RNA polymerase sigma-70 factor (ECF subfamily)